MGNITQLRFSFKADLMLTKKNPPQKERKQKNEISTITERGKYG